MLVVENDVSLIFFDDSGMNGELVLFSDCGLVLFAFLNLHWRTGTTDEQIAMKQIGGDGFVQRKASN